MNAIKLAILFHELYEKHASEYGYETKDETRIFNASSPNGKLMIRVCRELQKFVTIREQVYEKGNDFQGKGDDFMTYGINVGNHGNKIEVYKDYTLRNKILRFLQMEQMKG